MKKKRTEKLNDTVIELLLHSPGLCLYDVQEFLESMSDQGLLSEEGEKVYKSVDNYIWPKEETVLDKIKSWLKK